ncbi:MAG TPA: hypothetical protein VJS90_00120 [Pseudomonas sp.]|uniref:hypothetical protein n=1 Tax=Pseudomonas sp. TaxID=306 RepID=UPI002B47D96E|nr:hypothetical protein [Pseudomonas sp.]HKS11419.1 hypothetical protein [Pseudomonas sp.]
MMSDVCKVEYEKPTIPDLNALDELDLEKLGSFPLAAHIRYTGMQLDDLVRPRWVGASPSGEVFDDIGAELPVEANNLVNGIDIEVSNEAVQNAAGGWAFFSYTVNQMTESRRQFCFVGLRPQAAPETLSVLHGLPSHDLIIRPRELTDAGFTLVVAPYQAMQAGDRVILNLVGYDEYGDEDDDFADTLVVTKDHVEGKMMSFNIPKYWFSYLEKGHALASYSITFADGATLASPEQRFEIDSTAALPAYLPKPAIAGHAESAPLDPAKFRDGLTIHMPAYPEIAVSDRILMRWRSPASDLVLPVRVDPSSLVQGTIVFRLAADVLALSGGTTARLSYLYGREGASLSSEELAVDVIKPRSLSAPDVKGALPDSTPAWGTMTALDAIDGVYIEVPADIAAPGERLEVHWDGYSALGQYIATAPVRPENPRRFFIPAQYVAANLGRGEADESKRFDVFYRLVGSDHVDSVPYRLRIKPFETTAFPQITCTQASGGSLSLAKVPAAGANLRLGTWYLGAAGQLLTLTLSGVTANGPLEHVIRDRVAVTAEEAREGVNAILAKAVLEQLQISSNFTLRARVSFDGGQYFTPFRNSALMLSR